MSPRAACRLERLGFGKVYDYTLGLADWRAAGLPTEGVGPSEPVIGAATRTDVPTCRPDETLGTIRRRAAEAGWDQAVVLDCDRTVVGRIRARYWDGNDDTPVAAAMEHGPGTVRPHEPLGPLADKMLDRNIPVVLVTTPDGTLIGAVTRDQAKEVLDERPGSPARREAEGG